jgi:peroxiredoxin
MDLGFDLVDLGPADHVAEGESAPDFERPLVNDEFWEDVALSALLEDGPVALVFHPMAGSFPATYVWQNLPDQEWGDAQVIGCSIATPYAHKRLIEERDLGDDYRLYSDPGNGVAEAFGIDWELDGMTGVEEPRPAAFVIDTDGTVTYAWVAEEWPAFPPYEEVAAAAREL